MQGAEVKGDWALDRRAGRKSWTALGRAIAVAACMAGLTALSVAAGAAEETVAEPAGYRMADYRSPVPATLSGARVIGSEEAQVLRDSKAVFVDVYPQAPKPPNLPAGTVWRDPTHESIDGAVWLANVGYGVVPPAVQDYFKTHLETLTGGDKARTLVFFCLRNCWMSWNAAKRALEMGYTSVVWFPDGVDGWRDLALPTANLQPAP